MSLLCSHSETFGVMWERYQGRVRVLSTRRNSLVKRTRSPAFWYRGPRFGALERNTGAYPDLRLRLRDPEEAMGRPGEPASASFASRSQAVASSESRKYCRRHLPSSVIVIPRAPPSLVVPNDTRH